MGKFAELCDLLPADVNWGDNITPDIVEQIVLAEREACAKVCEDGGGYIVDDGAAAWCAAKIRTRSNAELRGRPLADGPA